jgi:hypothetical protein
MEMFTGAFAGITAIVGADTTVADPLHWKP